MKILKITFKNINSLRGEHVVDFTEKPLSHSRLFAITGPTGSGKSTILEALEVFFNNALVKIDLRGREADAGRVVHGLEHILDQHSHLLVDSLDRLGDDAKLLVGQEKDGANGHTGEIRRAARTVKPHATAPLNSPCQIVRYLFLVCESDKSMRGGAMSDVLFLLGSRPVTAGEALLEAVLPDDVRGPAAAPGRTATGASAFVVDRYGALLFAAYRFWRDDGGEYAVDEETLRSLLGLAPKTARRIGSPGLIRMAQSGSSRCGSIE